MIPSMAIVTQTPIEKALLVCIRMPEIKNISQVSEMKAIPPHVVKYSYIHRYIVLNPKSIMYVKGHNKAWIANRVSVPYVNTSQVHLKIISQVEAVEDTIVVEITFVKNLIKTGTVPLINDIIPIMIVAPKEPSTPST